MGDKKTLSAREVTSDIKGGFTDDQLMRKYELSAQGLQSLLGKLVNAGLITKEDLAKRGTTGNSPSPRQAKLPAGQIAADLKAGMSDDQIVKKYGIPAAKLPLLYDKLVKAGFLTKAELDQRSTVFEETVDIDSNTATFQPTAGPSQERATDVLAEFAARFKISNEDLERLKSASLKDLKEILDKYDIPQEQAAKLLKAHGRQVGAVSNFMKRSLGEKLIIIASGVAAFSLFLPWVESGIVQASGFQQQGFLLLALYVYPLLQTLRRSEMSKIGGGICAGLSVLASILFIESKSVALFGREINAAGTGLYLFTACSILLCVGVYLSTFRKEAPASGQVLVKSHNERSKGTSQKRADPNKAETELGLVNIILTKWWMVNASGEMSITNHRLLFTCKLWWVFAIITAGISYYVLKIGEEPLEFRWTDISGIVPTRHLFICDGILVRMKSGVEYKFFFPLSQTKDKEKLMGFIDTNLVR